MKLRLVIIIVIAVLASVICVGLYLRQKPTPVERAVDAMLDGLTPITTSTDELAELVDWYQPMVVDAPPEVLGVMKQFDAQYRAMYGSHSRPLETFYPADEWIELLLDKGIKIEDYDDYCDYLEDRWHLYHANNDSEMMARLKKRHGLGDAASWDQLVDAEIKENIHFKQLLDQAMEDDPKIYGGEIGADGTFIPFRQKTVYVQKGTISAGDGVPQWVPHELSHRARGGGPKREIPGDIEIIYLDAKGVEVTKDQFSSISGADMKQDVQSTLSDSEPSQDTTQGDTVQKSSLTDEEDLLEQQPKPQHADSPAPPRLPQSISELEDLMFPKLPTEKDIEAELDKSIPNPDNAVEELTDDNSKVRSL